MDEMLATMQAELPKYSRQFLRDFVILIDRLHQEHVGRNAVYNNAYLTDVAARLDEHKENVLKSFTAVADFQHPSISESISLFEDEHTVPAKLLVHVMIFLKWHNMAARHKKGWYKNQYIWLKKLFPTNYDLKSECMLCQNGRLLTRTQNETYFDSLASHTQLIDPKRKPCFTALNLQ